MNERVVTELVIDARNSTAGAAEFERAMAKASAAAEQQTTINGKLPTSLDRITAAYKRIEASIDPITKVQHQHEREMLRSQNAINRAVMAGVTTEIEAARVISSLRQKQLAEVASLRDAQQQLAVTGAGARRGGGGNFNNSNAAFQIQDIAMMSMMGQAPMMTALQQGPQLAMAMEAGGGLKSLAAGLASLVNPTMLITVGLTAATAAAVQFFMNMKSGSADSAEALKKQNELIAAVAARWGDAAPALKAYNDELTKQKDLADLLEASTAARSQQFVEERASVVDLTIDLDELINKLQILGGDPTQIVELQAAFANLQAKVKDSTATAEDAYAVQKELNDLMGTGLPIVGEYATKFGELAGQIGKAAEAAEKFDVQQRGSSLFNRDGLESILGNLDPLNGFNRTPFQNEEELLYARNKEPGSTRVGATGTMTNVNGVNVHQYMSDTAEYTEASADYLQDINDNLPGYFADIDETLKNDVTGSIAKYMGQLIYAQTLATQSIAEAVQAGIGIASQDSSGGSTASWAGRQFKVKVGGDIQQTVYDPRVHGSPQDFANLGLSTGGLKTNYAGMFAEGGDITVRGPTTGDRVPVMMHANGGETISVRKAGEGGGEKHFHLHYTPAPGDSEATTEQRARQSFGVMVREARRL